jgi:hypothetical protein
MNPFSDPDFLWHTLGGGAIVTGVVTSALTLVRLLLDYAQRRSERGLEHAERRHRQDRDAEARLERILQDRLADADRRLARADAELRAEQVHAATLEHDLTRVQQAYDQLKLEYAGLLQGNESRRTPR